MEGGEEGKIEGMGREEGGGGRRWSVGEGWREGGGIISRISYYHLILGILGILHVLVHITSCRG